MQAISHQLFNTDAMDVPTQVVLPKESCVCGQPVKPSQACANINMALADSSGPTSPRPATTTGGDAAAAAAGEDGERAEDSGDLIVYTSLSPYPVFVWC